MNYKIIDAVSPEGVEFQYLLVNDNWQVPMDVANPMYQEYLKWLEDPNAEITTPTL